MKKHIPSGEWNTAPQGSLFEAPTPSTAKVLAKALAPALKEVREREREMAALDPHYLPLHGKPGAKERDEGMARASAHADRLTGGEWTMLAYGFLEGFISTAKLAYGTFTTEAVREHAEHAKLPSPPDERAWGTVLMKAARAGIIEKAGYVESGNKQAHCRPVTLWRVKR